MMEQLLKEWREYVLLQEALEEVALCHSPADGTFDDCDAGSVYSLTKKAAKRNRIDPKYVQRGTVTSKDKGSPPKLTAKFGVNSSKKKSAGRKTIAGTDISPKYSVSKYPERYEEAEDRTNNPDWPSQKKVKRDRAMGKPNRKNWVHGYEEMNWLSKGLGHGVTEEQTLTMKEIREAVQQAFGEPEAITEISADAMKTECRKLGLVTQREAQVSILKALNAFALAKDGKLNAPKDKQ